MSKNIPDFELYKKDRSKYFLQLEEYLKGILKKSRYRHTIGVANTCACMAMKYGYDMDKAYLAGLLHDNAKGLSEEELLKLAKRADIKCSSFEKRHPFILHGPVGAYIAEKEFKINDREVLLAIANHTTGRPEMTLLEKIVFLADFFEPGRCEAPNLPQVRALAFEDIDRCLLRVLEDTLTYLKASGSDTDSKTLETYNYYKP